MALIKVSEVNEKVLSKYSHYKLCYVDSISPTYHDYDEETIKMIQSPEYQEYKKKKKAWYDEYFKVHHSMSGSTSSEWDRINNYNWKYGYKDYPTPDYEEGYTHYLYFTSNLNNQWGDDWDDAPYEYNAEVPYTHKTNVLIIRVRLPKSGLYLPSSRFANSPFSVRDINKGAIPWIFIDNEKYSLYLMGGETLIDCYNKLKEIKYES